MAFLQGKAEDGEETSSQGRCAQSDGGARGSSSSARTSSGSTSSGRTARSTASTTGGRARGRGRTGGRLVDGGVTALAVASLLALELLGVVALAVGAEGGVDAGVEPEVAHLGGNGLLVCRHHIFGDGSAVGAAAGVLQSGLRVMLVSCCKNDTVQTYSVAGVAVAGNVTLATAKVDAGVLLGVTP